MSTEQLVAEARAAAQELRANGAEILPLADAFQLDESTQRLFQALIGLGILAPDEVPALFALSS